MNNIKILRNTTPRIAHILFPSFQLSSEIEEKKEEH